MEQQGFSHVPGTGLSCIADSFIERISSIFTCSLLSLFFTGLLSLVTVPTYSNNAVAPEICDNGIDDDGDGLIDCADPDCSYFLATSIDVPIAIPSTYSDTVSSTLTVSSSGTITDLNIKALDISHTYIRDMRVRLIAPDGTTVTVLNRPCSFQDDIYMGLDDDADSNSYPCPPTDGLDYQPDNPLSPFVGKEIMGTWTLELIDVDSDHGGTINGWQLEFFFACAIEICDNGIDDDGDGLIDSNDPDCCGSPTSLSKNNWSLHYFDSEELVGEDGAATNAFDDDVNTFWHSEWFNTDEPLPHEIQIDLGANYNISGFQYLPRQTGVNGRIGDYEFYLSTDGVFWGSPKVSGTWTYSDFSAKEVLFATTTARYVRLRATSEANGEVWTSMAELYVLACASSEVCDNDIDDDLDGLTDCADSDCTVADAGSISGDESYCEPYTPIVVSSVAAGSAGASSSLQYQWQQTTDTASVAWSDVGAGDTSLTYQPLAISQSTFYRRRANTAHCSDSLFTNTVSKAVDQNATDAGTIGYDESVIGTYDPAAIVSTSDPSGGLGSLEYTWYSFSDSIWTLIPGATSSSYDPATISQTTLYRRFARIIGCEPPPYCCGSTWLGSNIVTKEVITPLTGGGEVKLVLNPGSGIVIAEASSPEGLMPKRASYQWECSDDGENWKDLYGANSPNLTFDRYEKHLYFRRKMRNVDFMPWAYSNIIVNEADLSAENASVKNIHDLIEGIDGCTVSFKTKLLLEGAKGKGILMRDDLREKGVLPFYTPYAAGGVFQDVKVDGGIFQKEGKKAVVDWISLELFRKMDDLSPICARPALLLRDGSICELDGESDLAFFDLPKGKYRLVVRHRNHAPVFSKRLKFKNGKAVAIQDLFLIDNGKLGTAAATMPSLIHQPGNIRFSGNEMLRGYEDTDFNMDGVAIPAGPGNEKGHFFKPLR